jgi:transcriptional regulator with GAF, ATPase, and Fis domain
LNHEPAVNDKASDAETAEARARRRCKRDLSECRGRVVESSKAIEMIVEALKLHHGSVSAAAVQLGLTRRMLTLRMQRYKLDYKDFRRLV